MKISEMMKVNRNTINEDIKCLYSNIKDEMRQNNDDFIKTDRQTGVTEGKNRKEHITDGKIDDVIKHEKLLLDVDAKINILLIRVSGSNPESKSVIQEGVIRDFVLYLLVKHRYSKLSKEIITSEIINIRQCSSMEAEKIFLHIEGIGLEDCKKYDGVKFFYDLLEFAFLRRYLHQGTLFSQRYMHCLSRIFTLRKRL